RGAVRGAVDLRQAGLRDLLPDQCHGQDDLLDQAKRKLQGTAWRDGMRWISAELLRCVRRGWLVYGPHDHDHGARGDHHDPGPTSDDDHDHAACRADDHDHRNHHDSATNHHHHVLHLDHVGASDDDHHVLDHHHHDPRGLRPDPDGPAHLGHLPDDHPRTA